LSLLVLRLNGALREAATAPPPPIVPRDVPVEELSDNEVQQLLGQLLAADPDADVLFAETPAATDAVEVGALSDDEVTALLTTMLSAGAGA